MIPLTLHDLHAAAGARLGERHGHELVLSHGDTPRGYRALRESVALQDRSGRGLVQLRGPDRVSFLHGQTTNEVNALPAGAGNGAAILTARGKMLGEVRVLKREDALWVDTELGFGPEVKAALERNCISEEVEFEELSGAFGQLGLYGPNASALLAQVAGQEVPVLAEHHHRALRLLETEVVLIGSAGPGAAGFDLVIPGGALGTIWRALLDAGAEPLGEEAYELARIEAGLPRFGADMTEETNPLEANLERDISYKKGCYVGQEVIAKATFRGHVNKKLAALCFASELPAPGTELSLDGRVVGKVTSAATYPDGRKLGLGYVKRDLARPDVLLQLASGGTATTLRLAAPTA
jgi:folate-binding protein YgfZ